MRELMEEPEDFEHASEDEELMAARGAGRGEHELMEEPERFQHASEDEELMAPGPERSADEVGREESPRE